MAQPRNLKKLTLTPEQAAARRAMDLKIRKSLDEGERVPCLWNPLPYWGEGTERERIEAAQQCGECPAFAECDAWRLTANLKGGLIAAGQLV